MEWGRRDTGGRIGVFLVANTSWPLIAVSAGTETTRGSGIFYPKEHSNNC